MISKKLLKIYTDTDFIFYPDNDISILKIGKANKTLDKILQRNRCSSCVYITAWNPRSKLLSISDNNQRMKTLKSYLNRKKMIYIHGIGRSPDGKHFEDSLLVLGCSKDDAFVLGQKFDQNAVVYYESKRRAELLLIRDF
jgi:hypothetical protein